MQVTNQTTRPQGRTRAHTPAQVNVLIACEESQAECKAFRALGFNAYSCDIQTAHGGHPDWHINADVTPFLQGRTQFTTQDGKRHRLSRWHLIIAHPPCTYLCKVGSPHMYAEPRERVMTSVGELWVNADRYAKQVAAADFFRTCLNASCQFLAVENPIPMRMAGLPRPDTYLHPSWFGVKYTKKTLFWLRNLPPIMPTCEHPTPKEFVRASRGKYRSRTFPQVAAALAEQWGGYIIAELSAHH